MPTVDEQLNSIDAKLDRYTTECRKATAAATLLAARIEERLAAHERQDDRLFDIHDKARRDGDQTLHERVEGISSEIGKERRRPAVYASAGTGIGAMIVVVFEAVRTWFGSGGPGNG